MHQDLSVKHYGTTFDVCEELVSDTGRCCSYYTGEHFVSTRKASSGSRDGGGGGGGGAGGPQPPYFSTKMRPEGPKKCFWETWPPPYLRV